MRPRVLGSGTPRSAAWPRASSGGACPQRVLTPPNFPLVGKELQRVTREDTLPGEAIDPLERLARMSVSTTCAEREAPPLRVLLDARPAASGPGGIARYTASAAEALTASQRHLVWTLGRGGSLARRFESPSHEQLVLPALLERERIDVFHSPLFRLPALLPCEGVVTVHDAIPAVRPDLAPESFVRLFQRSRAGLERAAAVVCPTLAAKRDLEAHLGLPCDRLHVVPEAPASVFTHRPAGQDEALRAKFGLPSAFLLVVGGLEARKNPGTVLAALALLESASSPVHCVFVGRPAGYDLAGEARRLGVEERVHSLGVVSDQDLAALYRACAALVFPSLYEGFGLPVIEAFACRAPVITSSDPALREVGGEAALTFEAQDAEGLANAIDRVLGDPGLARELRERGDERLDSNYTPGHVLAAFELLYDSIRGTA